MSTASSQKSPTPSKPSESEAPSARGMRSPNYPSMPFMDALERVKKVYAMEKKHPVLAEIAMKHMGWALNGRSRMYLSSMKHYGLLIADGTGSVRVSDLAAQAIVLPESDPARAAAIRELAMQPKAFKQVITKYGTSLPSDASLAAFLQLELEFTPDACPVFIAALKHAIAVAGIDGARNLEETGADSSSEATMTPTSNAVAAPPTVANMPAQAPIAAPPLVAHVVAPTLDGAHEHHKWKLADGVWAEITIVGKLGPKGFDKLKKYVDLIDVSEDDA